MNRKEVAVIVLLLAPLSMRAQFRRFTSRNREDMRGYLSYATVGVGNISNQQFNQWLASDGKSPFESMIAIDLITIKAHLGQHWFGGVSFGVLISEPNEHIGSYDFVFSIGRSVFSSQRFQSNLNANFLAGKSVISDIVPTGISNPDPTAVLYSSFFGFGLSHSNYFTLTSWYKKGNKRSLAFGFEYGVNFTGQSSWTFGHSVHKNANPGISIPGVPNFDPTWTYIKFSLTIVYH